MIELKTEPPYFDLVWKGEKSFEIRRWDRDFHRGKIVKLKEYIPEERHYTGRFIIACITCIITYEQKTGYVVFGLDIMKKGYGPMQDELSLCNEIALGALKGQRRRGGSSAIDHARRVQFSFPEEFLLHRKVAVLHDVLEDTDFRKRDLLDMGVSGQVVHIVGILTKGTSENYFAYIRRVRCHDVAKVVKIADIVDNLSDAPTDRQKEKYLFALWYLAGTESLEAD